jgi:hypothetical protein
VADRKEQAAHSFPLAHLPPLPQRVRMGQITNQEELKAWLKDKPHKWSVAIALRCALRVLPIATNPARHNNNEAPSEHIFMMFRALSVSSASRYLSPDKMKKATRAAGNHLYSLQPTVGFRSNLFYVLRTSEATVDTSSASGSAAEAAELATAAEIATFRGTRSVDAAAYAVGAAGDSDADAIYANANITATTANAAAEASDADAIWQSVTLDADFLESGNSHKALLSQPLWQGTIPTLIAPEIAAMCKTLPCSPDGFGLWLDWYERRLAGAPTGFALPPVQDQEMYRRLVAQNDDWWQRKPAEVHAEIQSWLDELTPDKEEAQLETIRTRLAIGIKPDFSAPEAESARVAIKKSIASARPILHDLLPAQIGHNNPPEDEQIESSTQTLPSIGDIIRFDSLFERVEETVDHPEPDVVRLVEDAGLIKRSIDRLRALSPEGMKEFEKTLGANAGRAIAWGISALILSLTGALGELLDFLKLVLG